MKKKKTIRTTKPSTVVNMERRRLMTIVYSSKKAAVSIKRDDFNCDSIARYNNSVVLKKLESTNFIQYIAKSYIDVFERMIRKMNKKGYLRTIRR